MLEVSRKSTETRFTIFKPGVRIFGILCAIAGASLLAAGDFSTYRGFQFGMNLPAAAKQAAVQLSDARTVHQRPALIQELDWRPGSPLQVNPAKADPIQEGRLSFYDGELYRIVVTYDRYKVEGMTVQDMVDAISATYGTATKPTAEIAYHSNYGELAPVIARWENPDYSYNLVRNGDQSSFALILYSKRVDTLAQSAIAGALRMDVQDAPGLEKEKQQKRAEEARLVLENARLLNKPNFRP